jgi:aminopeptidase N
MPDTAHQPIHRKDYAPPAFLIDRVDLAFDLGDATTRVRARLMLRRNKARADAAGAPLVLDGRKLELAALRLDDRPLAAAEYAVDEEHLTVHALPERCVLEIETVIRPQDNTELEGLYFAAGMFCTQCEAEGFRKITYFLDRPDVMARYTVTITADRARCPVLLSNGNKIAEGALEGGRHFARWEDPFPKPAYLFALVAGDLGCVEDEFTTRSGRRVALRIFTEHDNVDKCGHAMTSLKKAMKWDEDVFGLEYDLDIFMIVAIGAFNMGAMENKGLNVFNTKYVLARPDTATDQDYLGIESVIAHEYFHNWTGDRVTCRDWFQLSLKEGLTVFRDQQFSADMNSEAVKRISDVRGLRAGQFPEDASPMAHPVRPDSYIEINNFYTATVYVKGAEVVRMIHTLLGPARFRKGMDLYFERHDGQAVTCDDFVAAMADASGVDLEQFKLWYSQSGTPELSVQAEYDAAARSYTLTVEQSCPPTPGQPDKQPFHIPLSLGLLDRQGRDLPLQLEGENAPPAPGTRTLDLRQRRQSFRFVNLPEPPTPSLLRGFSAPVKLKAAWTDTQLQFLMAHDSDAFARWEAGQQLAVKLMLGLIADQRAGRALALDPGLVEAVARILDEAMAAGRGLDAAFVAQALSLPAESYVGELMAEIDPGAIHAVREHLRSGLAEALAARWRAVYQAQRDDGPYQVDARAIGRRSLKNLCLSYLVATGAPNAVALCLEQARAGTNMTDVLTGLALLADTDRPERDAALAEFYARWRDDPLVVDKWFSIQAVASAQDTIERVRALLSHPAFDIKNPNRVRALVGAFASNQVRFHDPSGAGYAFLGDQVLALDPINPKVGARMIGPLGRWRRYDARRRTLMRAQLERVVGAPDLSRDVYEIASKSLA